jgi:lipoate---protein ligase
MDFLRRYSGGGTVYHDLGNANFSIRMPRHEFNRQTYAEMIVRAIERKGVSGCKVTQRGDIAMHKGEDGYKVSGSAYKVAKDMAYHHGTMLLGSDLNELRKALRVDGRVMIRDKGVDSIRANHVANVPFPGEDNMAKFNNFVETVREEFTDMHGKHRFIELTEENVKDFPGNPEIQKGMDKLSVGRPGKLIRRAGIGSLVRHQNLQKNYRSMRMYLTTWFVD